ncbi:MAG: hypothetical protein OEW60_03325 [Thiovulaceae bacterium]|nr:hypothetical protein [Sulfurimonadaceae bacterium]
MNIKIEERNENITVRVEGVVKSIVDSQNIQDAIDALSSENNITIDFVDSFSLTSTVIGFLLKKIQKDKFKITLLVHDKRLWELLGHLNLTGPLNAEMV